MNYTSMAFLILLIIVYFISKKLTNPLVNKNLNDPINYLKYLDSYFVKDIAFTSFAVGFYFTFTILPFMVFRYTYIGTTTDLYLLNIKFITKHLIVNVVVLLLTIVFYLKVLNTIFYIYVIRLHFYLYQFDWYIWIYDFQRNDYYRLTTTLLTFVRLFLYYITLNRKELIEYFRTDYKRCKATYLTKFWSKKRLYWKVVYFFLFICENKLINIIIKTTNDYLITKLAFHGSRFVQYIPITIMIIIFMYDIFKNHIFYTYYILLIYFIVAFISRCRYFIHVKDCYIDDVICTYFYKNTTPYKQFQIILLNQTTNVNFHNYQINSLIVNQEDILSYFTNGFEVYYISDTVRKNNEQYLNNFAKRSHMILLLFLCNIYLSKQIHYHMRHMVY